MLHILPFAALSAVTSLALTYSRMTSSINRWEDDLADMTKVGTVTILLPTLNEAENIEKTIASLRYQNLYAMYPEYFELVVADSYSTDGTFELASAYADRVLTVPKGKLTAINHAVAQCDSDIIVAVDGDSMYFCNFLNLILKHFEDPEVVAVSGVEVYDDHRFPFLTSLLLEHYYCRLAPRLMGRGCAYTRKAFYDTGGFDDSVNQKDVIAMVNEEEFGFYRRLSAVGKVIREYRASVVTSSRRLIPSNVNYAVEQAKGERF